MIERLLSGKQYTSPKLAIPSSISGGNLVLVLRVWQACQVSSGDCTQTYFKAHGPKIQFDKRGMDVCALFCIFMCSPAKAQTWRFGEALSNTLSQTNPSK